MFLNFIFSPLAFTPKGIKIIIIIRCGNLIATPLQPRHDRHQLVLSPILTELVHVGQPQPVCDSIADRRNVDYQVQTYQSIAVVETVVYADEQPRKSVAIRCRAVPAFQFVAAIEHSTVPRIRISDL